MLESVILSKLVRAVRTGRQNNESFVSCLITRYVRYEWTVFQIQRLSERSNKLRRPPTGHPPPTHTPPNQFSTVSSRSALLLRNRDYSCCSCCWYYSRTGLNSKMWPKKKPNSLYLTFDFSRNYPPYHIWDQHASRIISTVAETTECGSPVFSKCRN